MQDSVTAASRKSRARLPRPTSLGPGRFPPSSLAAPHRPHTGNEPFDGDAPGSMLASVVSEFGRGIVGTPLVGLGSSPMVADEQHPLPRQVAAAFEALDEGDETLAHATPQVPTGRWVARAAQGPEPDRPLVALGDLKDRRHLAVPLLRLFHDPVEFLAHGVDVDAVVSINHQWHHHMLSFPRPV